MNDAFLRQAAEAAVRGEQVMAHAQAELAKVLIEIDRGEYIFQELPSPKGSRALQAVHKTGCSILIAQFNHERDGIGHAGTAVRMKAGRPMLINMPREVADYVYHKAVAGRN